MSGKEAVVEFSNAEVEVLAAFLAYVVYYLRRTGSAHNTASYTEKVKAYVRSHYECVKF